METHFLDILKLYLPEIVLKIKAERKILATKYSSSTIWYRKAFTWSSKYVATIVPLKIKGTHEHEVFNKAVASKLARTERSGSLGKCITMLQPRKSRDPSPFGEDNVTLCMRWFYRESHQCDLTSSKLATCDTNVHHEVVFRCKVSI